MSEKSTRLLEDFTSGRTELKKFWRTLNDFLFDLRESGESPSEEASLTGLQALLHEMDEGLRTRGEIYSYAAALLRASKPVTTRK